MLKNTKEINARDDETNIFLNSKEVINVAGRAAIILVILSCIFSDAYLTTVPAKKRRLADARKPVEGSTGDNVQRALADAIKVTGVKPSTSQQAAAHSLARNTNVEKTLEVS